MQIHFYLRHTDTYCGVTRGPVTWLNLGGQKQGGKSRRGKSRGKSRTGKSRTDGIDPKANAGVCETVGALRSSKSVSRSLG